MNTTNKKKDSNPPANYVSVPCTDHKNCDDDNRQDRGCTPSGSSSLLPNNNYYNNNTNNHYSDLFPSQNMQLYGVHIEPSMRTDPIRMQYFVPVAGSLQQHTQYRSNPLINHVTDHDARAVDHDMAQSAQIGQYHLEVSTLMTNPVANNIDLCKNNATLEPPSASANSAQNNESSSSSSGKVHRSSSSSKGAKSSRKSKPSHTSGKKSSCNSTHNTAVEISSNMKTTFAYTPINTTEEMLKLGDLYQVIFNAGDAKLMYQTFRKKCLQSFFVQTYCFDPMGEKDYSAGTRFHRGWEAYYDYLEDVFRTIPDGVGVSMNVRIDDSREESILVVADYVFTGTFVGVDTPAMFPSATEHTESNNSNNNSITNSSGNDQVQRNSNMSRHQFTSSSILNQFVTVEESTK